MERSRSTFAEAQIRSSPSNSHGRDYGPASVVTNPTSESLLSANHDFVNPHRQWRSPYDLIDAIPGLSSIYSPRSVSPPPPSTTKLIGIDNYDPRSPQRVFTDPLTIRAVHNLKIRQCDVFFPTDEDLARIQGDRAFYRDRLIERALRLAGDVRLERQRIIQELSKGEEPSSPVSEPSRQALSRWRGRFITRPPGGIALSRSEVKLDMVRQPDEPKQPIVVRDPDPRPRVLFDRELAARTTFHSMRKPKPGRAKYDA
jgi:hypothetical protein